MKVAVSNVLPRNEGSQVHVAVNETVTLLKQFPILFAFKKNETRPSVPITVAVIVVELRKDAAEAFPGSEIVMDVGDLVVVIDVDADERVEFP